MHRHKYKILDSVTEKHMQATKSVFETSSSPFNSGPWGSPPSNRYIRKSQSGSIAKVAVEWTDFTVGGLTLGQSCIQLRHSGAFYVILNAVRPVLGSVNLDCINRVAFYSLQ